MPDHCRCLARSSENLQALLDQCLWLPIIVQAGYPCVSRSQQGFGDPGLVEIPQGLLDTL